MKTSFQTIVIIVFIAAFVISIAVFSGLFSTSANKNSSTPQGTVVIWGVVPQQKMQAFADSLNANGAGYSVSYSEHKPETIVADITGALADGNPPDDVILSSELLAQLRSRLYVIPYAAYSERAFRDTNVDGAQIFLSQTGVLALPLAVDPLVAYYNKDLLSGANFVTPPLTWTALAKSVPLFTRRASAGGLSQVAVALGTENNIENFRDILSTLFLQTGDQLVTYDKSVSAYASVLGQNGSGSSQALTFYTGFSDPTATDYTWNRSLPGALSMFASGKSAFYLGRASELFNIQSLNPNLNFDVMPIFQPENASRTVTFGSYLAVGVMKSSRNFNAAYAAASAIGTQSSVDTFSKLLSLPPARRDLLQVQQNNAYVSVFFRSALAAFSWPDPNPPATKGIFRDMITQVNSGQTDASGAIYNANTSLQSSIH